MNSFCPVPFTVNILDICMSLNSLGSLKSLIRLLNPFVFEILCVDSSIIPNGKHEIMSIISHDFRYLRIIIFLFVIKDPSSS